MCKAERRMLTFEPAKIIWKLVDLDVLLSTTYQTTVLLDLLVCIPIILIRMSCNNDANLTKILWVIGMVVLVT